MKIALSVCSHWPYLKRGLKLSDGLGKRSPASHTKDSQKLGPVVVSSASLTQNSVPGFQN